MNDHIEVLPKQSVKLSWYLGTPICVVLGVMIILDSGSLGSEIILSSLGAVIILIGLLWLPYLRNFKINFGPDSVKQGGLISRQIPYQKIEELIVSKGYIEIRGDGMFNSISIGDLYTNFDEAVHLLARQIEGKESITLKGKKKYINKYLGPSG